MKLVTEKKHDDVYNINIRGTRKRTLKRSMLKEGVNPTGLIFTNVGYESKAV